MTDEMFPETRPLPKPRPRDEVWDALAAIFGEPTTRSNRSLRNKITGSQREAAAI